MRRIVNKLLAVLIAGGLLTAPLGASQARAANDCHSWSEARSKGLIEKFRLRPAKEIKASVEARYNGQVVSFVICVEGGKPIYKLVVYRKDNGTVINVEEPAQ